MANKHMLDSSAWIEYFAGTETGKKVEYVIENEEILTCMLSIAEISDKFCKEDEKFGRFLDFIKSVSAVSNITIETCSEAGKLKAQRRSIKKEFKIADAIIYLTARENSCIVVTKDADFEGMENVVVIK